MAHSEACQLFIEQQIEESLEEGKTPYAIGQELSKWIQKLFETKIQPRTIEQRARRQNATNVAKKIETKPDTSKLEKKTHGGAREGAGKKPKPVFNETNENIEWARWTWNPVTGCKHGCQYCYARDIANRFYDEKFEPTFRPERLEAPYNTNLNGKQNNVFVCSMADLFGEWVPDEWIEKILNVIKDTPQWNYLFLTKNPQRYLTLEFPENCWLGATADTQKRADIACNVFDRIDNNIRFISCEPLMEEIIFNPMSFDWLIIGGRSQSSGMPAGQPEWEWVEILLNQARSILIPVYFKPNLTARPKEYPGDWGG